MLKIRLNTNEIFDDKDRVNVLYYRNLDIDNNDSEKEKSKTSLLVKTNNLEKIRENTQIICQHNVYYQQVNGNSDSITFIEKYNVKTINEMSNTFSLLYDKYRQLEVERVYIDSNEKNEEVVYFVFQQPHFFNENDEDISLYFTYENEFVEIRDCSYSTNKIIAVYKNKLELHKILYGYIFPETNEGVTTFISVYRKNYFFTEIDNQSLYYDNPKCNITIPLTKKYDIDLMKETWINDYVIDSKKKCINPIVDMEKDIYYPVFPHTNAKGDYEYVNKIVFNLHFREHTGENWLVESNSLWNGLINDGTIKFNDDFFNLSTNEGKSQQSDLLTYLNFTDSDVRYQKNKLKKSFLRLLFYDSDNPANQNLLMYSTIFMKSGEYFNKFIKYFEEIPYKSLVINNDGDIEVIKNLKGVRVNREPDGTLIMSKTVEEIEEKRLSSQFVVEDKYHSEGSSEGFYIYLWRNILDGLMTEEEKRKGLTLYMKVEFNHAGYGRAVPFMMPYWDKKKWKSKEGIKRFDEIVNDWNNKNGTDGQYGARQYSKFSYIKLNIKYDENKGNYIYCLSDEYYGKSSTEKTDDNSLIINLYEANMV